MGMNTLPWNPLMHWDPNGVMTVPTLEKSLIWKASTRQNFSVLCIVRLTGIESRKFGGWGFLCFVLWVSLGGGLVRFFWWGFFSGFFCLVELLFLLVCLFEGFLWGLLVGWFWFCLGFFLGGWGPGCAFCCCWLFWGSFPNQFCYGINPNLLTCENKLCSLQRLI